MVSNDQSTARPLVFCRLECCKDNTDQMTPFSFNSVGMLRNGSVSRCLQQLWFPVANPPQDIFSAKTVLLQTEMGWMHQMRPLSFNSVGMLRNGSGEQELLGMFGARVLQTTLVSGCQSTAMFPVANALQDIFPSKMVLLQPAMGWAHLMRLLRFNSVPMLRNANGEPELLGRFGVCLPPTTLVSSGQSTARHLFHQRLHCSRRKWIGPT